MQKIIKKQAKEIFSKTKLPGFDYVINQYVGCGHNCAYCYARFISTWKGYGPWGKWIEVKTNAPQLVKNRYVDGWVFMSSVSDAYQSIEKELHLTRNILQEMDKNIKLSILTKSDLVLRDIDLLKQFKDVELGFTLNTFEGKEKALFEPDSPSFEDRIIALKTLKENGIKTYGFVSPIIPGLIDLDKVIDHSRNLVQYYWFETINFSAAGKDFQKIIRSEYPESYKILSNKENMHDYINNLKNNLQDAEINIRGIETHSR